MSIFIIWTQGPGPHLKVCFGSVRMIPKMTAYIKERREFLSICKFTFNNNNQAFLIAPFELNGALFTSLCLLVVRGGLTIRKTDIYHRCFAIRVDKLSNRLKHCENCRLVKKSFFIDIGLSGISCDNVY